MSQLNTKGGPKSQKQYYTRAKAKAAQEKAKHKRSASTIHIVSPQDYITVDQIGNVEEPDHDSIYRQQRQYQKQALMAARRNAISTMQNSLINQAQEQNRLFGLLYRTRDPAFIDTYNPNAVINEPANDIASRAIPWHMLLLQNQIQSGSSSSGVPQLRNETDLQQGTSMQDIFSQKTDQDMGQSEGQNIGQQLREEYQQAKLWSDQLIQDNKETNKLEYKAGAPVLGLPPINSTYTNNPYPVRNTGYYMNQGGMPSLKLKNEVYDKWSKINKPKERKNYIKTSKLIQSAIAQGKLKKYGKNKKK